MRVGVRVTPGGGSKGAFPCRRSEAKKKNGTPRKVKKEKKKKGHTKESQEGKKGYTKRLNLVCF